MVRIVGVIWVGDGQVGPCGLGGPGGPGGQSGKDNQPRWYEYRKYMAFFGLNHQIIKKSWGVAPVTEEESGK